MLGAKFGSPFHLFSGAMSEPDSPRRLGSASTERTERTERPAGDATPATQLPKKGGISLGGLKRSSSHVAAVLGSLAEAAGGEQKGQKGPKGKAGWWGKLPIW